MLTKAEQTTKYIVETVAPIFNKKGYAATSMTDIVKATGLTKGAIYGNFENKEAIAIAAFDKNVNDLLVRIANYQKESNSPLQKLFLITEFYRNYTEHSEKMGGCPILNIGVDANNQDTKLLERVQYIINKTQNNIVKLVDWAKTGGELKEGVDSKKFAKYFYTTIQGAVFMSHTMKDRTYLVEAANQIDLMINSKLKK